MRTLQLFVLALLVSACATQTYTGSTFPLSADQSVVMMPLVNRSDTPFAAENTERILTSVWHAAPLPELSLYPSSAKAEGMLPSLDDKVRLQRAKEWLAQQSSYTYYLSGSIDEWQYRPGIERTPVVGITLSLYRSDDHSLVWSVSGSRSGSLSESLSGTAQNVLENILLKLVQEKSAQKKIEKS